MRVIQNSEGGTPLSPPENKFQRCWYRYLACLGLYALQEINIFVKPFPQIRPRIFLEGKPDIPSGLLIEEESLDHLQIDNLQAFNNFLRWVDPNELESRCDFAWDDPSRPPLKRLWEDVEKSTEGDFKKRLEVTQLKEQLLSTLAGMKACYVVESSAARKQERTWMYDKQKHVVDLHGLTRGTAFSLATGTLEFTREKRDTEVVFIVGNEGRARGERGHTVATAVKDTVKMCDLAEPAQPKKGRITTYIGVNDRETWVVGPDDGKEYFTKNPG